MLTIGDKQYRNLQEQVFKNKDDIDNIRKSGNLAELGITVVNAEVPLSTSVDLPNPTTYTGNYGDAYIVGEEAPFSLYVYSRSSNPDIKGFWFNWGTLNAPSVIPGPIGPQGLTGPQGIRGSFWYSQTGVPTNTEGVNANDQALDGSNGNTYQFVNGAWQLTGNIRGPQGIQGIQGLVGPTGPVGPVGPQGPKGDQGQFIQIVGSLTNINQLPSPDSVPRYTAYVIPIDGVEHVYLIIGEGTTESPLLWHDAGGFGGGTQVKIDGVNQSEVELGYVPKISVNYQIGEDTTVSTNGSEVTISNLQTTGYNVNNEQIEGQGTIELPIANSNEIVWNEVDNTLQAGLHPDVYNEIANIAQNTPPPEVQITAPTTSTNGQLTEAQLETLQENKDAYLMFNNEIYRLQDTQHESGYLVYSHLGYENTTQTYMIKCITITVSTMGWVLTTRSVLDPTVINNYYDKDTLIPNAGVEKYYFQIGASNRVVDSTAKTIDINLSIPEITQSSDLKVGTIIGLNMQLAQLASTYADYSTYININNGTARYAMDTSVWESRALVVCIYVGVKWTTLDGYTFKQPFQVQIAGSRFAALIPYIKLVGNTTDSTVRQRVYNMYGNKRLLAMGTMLSGNGDYLGPISSITFTSATQAVVIYFDINQKTFVTETLSTSSGVVIPWL